MHTRHLSPPPSGGARETPSLADRRQGGLLGLLMGDAAGVPFEFHHLQDLAGLPRSSFALPFVSPSPDFIRAHPTAPAHAWSDDGAQALALLDSLHACGGLDLEDFAVRIRAWADQGDYAVNARVFDMGIQTRRALDKLKRGVSPHESGPSDRFENGNGSLMRVLPLALWHTGSDEQLVEWAHEQSLITHGHTCSQVCCALLCLWARNLLAGATDGFDQALGRLREVYKGRAAFEFELEQVLSAPHRSSPTGSGYVVDCLWSARHAFLASAHFDEVVEHAIALGRDTDTTAAVAGGLAGVRAGASGLPQFWLESLALHPSLPGLLGVLSARPV